jgi:hypothetical protein
MSADADISLSQLRKNQMKKLFAVILLLVMSATAMAESTLCMPNDAGAEIHLLAGERKYAVALSSDGTVVRGIWKILGTTKIMIDWEGFDVRIYDLYKFKKCEL